MKLESKQHTDIINKFIQPKLSIDGRPKINMNAKAINSRKQN